MTTATPIPTRTPQAAFDLVGESPWAHLACQLATNEALVHRWAAEIADAIHREVPELDGDHELVDATRESAAENLRMFVSMAHAGIPAHRGQPGALAEQYVRLLVHRGVAIEAVTAIYRVGLQTFWPLWTELLRERLPATGLADALDESVRFLFSLFDALLTRVVEIYGEERAVWIRSGEAIRAETIRALLDGNPPDLATAEQRLGYPLHRRHRCAIVWSEDHAAGPRACRAAAERVIDELGGTGALYLEINRTTIACWTAVSAATPVTSAADGVCVALGVPEPGIEGFRQSYLDAMDARRVAVLRGASTGSVVRYEDVTIQALASADLARAGRFVAMQLGPLAVDSPAHRDLADTLLAYLQHASNLRTTATAMGIHTNTVANRLRRIEQLLDEPITGRTGDLLLALQLLELTRGTTAPGSAS